MKSSKGLLLALLSLVASAGRPAIGAVGEGKRQLPEYVMEIERLSEGPSHRGDYEYINKHLVDKVKSYNMQDNMDAALQLLQARKSWNPSLPIVEALEQFTGLIGLDNQCDWAAFETLFKNVKATGIDTEGWSTFSRVDDLVLKKLVKHSDNCYRVYPAKFRAKLAKMDQEVLRRVDTFTEGFLLRYSNWRGLFSARSKIKVLLDNFVLKTESIDQQRDARIALEALRTLAKEDPDSEYFQYVADQQKGVFEFREDKVKQLFDTYLVGPCEQYNRELGPDVFVPANFDAMYKLNFDLAEIQYHEAWARFRICTVLIEHDYEALLEQLLTLVRQSLGERPTLPPPSPASSAEEVQV